MSKKLTYAEKRRYATLRRYYTIHGDGVAKLDLSKAIKSPRFKKTINELKNMNYKKDE